MPDLTLVNMATDPVTGERVMPLGPLCLTAALEQAGFEVELRDVQLLDVARTPFGCLSFESLAEVFATDAPVLGVSVMSDRIAETLFALRLFKQRHPRTLVVLGGAGPTEVAEAILRAFPCIDAVARGEGEDTAVEMMRRLRASGYRREALAGVPGLSANVDGQLVIGPERERIRDVDRLPYPEGCTWDLSPYAGASLMSARGCPYRCTFCSIVELWGQTMGYRSVERVVDEIAWLRDQKPGAYVHIEDDTFTVHRRRVLAFCDELERRDVRVEWGCTGRIDTVDAELVERMHAAGCRSIFLGIESGADEVRARVLKRFASEEVFDTVDMLRRRLAVTCHYIWGYPFESLAEFHETFLHIGYLQALGVTARHSHLVPFPRAPMIAEYIAQNRGTIRFRERYPFPRLFLLDPTEPYVDEVRANPAVFLPYFSVETPDEDAKFEFVAAFSQHERAT